MKTAQYVTELKTAKDLGLCLAGAMAELGRSAEIVDYVESWVFNSNKCIAVFPA